MAFEPTKPAGTSTGPTVVVDTRANLVALKALIDALIPKEGLGTYGLTPTWEGQHVWDAAGIVVKRAHGGDFLILEQKTIEGGHTNAHTMRFLATDSGATLAIRPTIDGVDTPTKQWGFDYAVEAWKIGTALVWHADNFDPLTLAPDSLAVALHKQKVTKLTSGTSIAVNPATQGEFFILQLAHTSTITFTLPTGADGDLGDHYIYRGVITIENITGAGVVTLVATGADKTETNGTQDNTVGQVMTLAYTITRFDAGGERLIVNFAWNS